VAYGSFFLCGWDSLAKKHSKVFVHVAKPILTNAIVFCVAKGTALTDRFLQPGRSLFIAL